MCSYELHEPSGWTDAVAAFPQQRSDEGRTVTLAGKCPRCNHDLSVELPIEDRTGKKVDDTHNNEELREKKFVKVAFCNCAASHKDRPEDGAGCGAYGALLVG